MSAHHARVKLSRDGIESLFGGLSQLMEEVSSEVVFTLLELFLRELAPIEDRDVKTELLALEQVRVEEVDDLARVLPRPSTQDSGTVDSVGAHVVIQKWVEVEIGKTSHLSLKAAHFKLGLVVHLTDELLSVLQLHLPLFLLLTKQIWALLMTGKENNIVKTSFKI